MTDERRKVVGLTERLHTERLKGRGSGVLLIVTVVGLAMMLFAFVMLMAR